MVLELHIWGPGFGLPSIDPCCLATVALLRECLQLDEWVLVPTSDPSVSPLGELPALKDGELWVAGFANIATYLKDASDGAWALGGVLSLQQTADCTAYLTFVESRGLPLLDLLLYVSSENYNSCTKPALGRILSWPASWVLPSRLRARAKKRSEHLGLSSLDVDTIEDDKSKDEGLTAQIPASLRKPKMTVSSILGKDLRRNKFRLDAVNADFLEPLEDLLGQQDWLFGDEPSNADCLAISVLVLMYFPSDLPHQWLKSTMDTKHPRLARWVTQHASTWFGDVSSVPMTASDQQRFRSSTLAWQQPSARDWHAILNAIATTATEALPGFGSLFASKEVETANSKSSEAGQRPKQTILARRRKQHLVYSQSLISTLCLTTLVGILMWKGYLHVPRRAPRGRNFGQAGNIFGLG